MPTTNVFTSFNNTQFDGDIDQVMDNYLKNYGREKYKDLQISNLSKEELEKELIGEKELSESSKHAVKKAIEYFTEDTMNIFNGYGTASLSGAEKLNKAVGDFKERANFMILTESKYPNAIKALYEINGFNNLKNIEILQNRPENHKESQNRNKIISDIENKALENGADKVFNIFIDHYEREIDSFKKGRDLARNIGIHVSNGMSDRTLIKLDNVLSFTNAKESLQSSVLLATNKNKSNSIEDLLSIGLPKRIGKEKYKSVEDLLSAGLQKTKNEENKSTDDLSMSSFVINKEKKGPLQTFRSWFAKRKGGDSESAMLVEPKVAGAKALSSMIKPMNANQQKSKQTSETASSAIKEQNVQSIDKASGAIPKTAPKSGPKKRH